MGERKDKPTRRDYREEINRLRLLDDNFMTAVFSRNEKAVQLVLRIIIGKQDLIVVSVKVQDEKHNLRGRSVRLDVHAIDSKGVHYDIEIQRSDSGADPRRARFNLSLMDSENLGKSLDFTKLPETYIIFITESDIFGRGLPMYHIDRRLRETGELFEDKAYIIYVNGEYRAENAIGRLMADFRETDPDKMHYEDLAEPARYLKGTEEGVQSMCRIFEKVADENFLKGKQEGREEGMQEGREEGKAELVKEMRRSMSGEQIASLLNLPLDRVLSLLGD